MQMVEKDTSGSGTIDWLMFAQVFLGYFFFSLFLKLVISLLLKNLKSLSWSLCNFNSPDYQVSESCTPIYAICIKTTESPLYQAFKSMKSFA